MSFFQMLVKDVEFDAVLIKTVHQEDTNEYPIDSEDYIKTRAVCFFHPADLKKIGVKKGNIFIKSEVGQVVVRIEESERETREGLITLPLSPWSLQLVKSKENCMPEMYIKVRVKSTEADITNIKSIIETLQR
ncbi:MAG: molybdopterin dinucleotide binding domain-containing protein [Candidatus Helarchaeota archaeon]